MVHNLVLSNEFLAKIYEIVVLNYEVYGVVNIQHGKYIPCLAMWWKVLELFGRNLHPYFRPSMVHIL